MKPLSRSGPAVLCLLLVLLIPCSCQKDEDENPDDVIIPETTRVISPAQWNDYFVSVDSAAFTYVFDEDVVSAAGLEVGDIMVSQAGGGCLRRISGIQQNNGQATISTTFASIAEAVEQGSVTIDYHLTAAMVKNVRSLDDRLTVRPVQPKSGESTALTYELSTYLDDDEAVEITATLSIDPTISGEVSISGFSVKKFKMEFQVDEEVEIEAVLTLLNIEWEKEKTLLSIEFTPITIFIGAVPIVLTPEIEVKAGVSLEINSAITTSVVQTLTYTVGISYENGKWSTYNEVDNDFGYNPPELSATAEAKAYLKPQFSMKVYEVISPYLFAEFYARLEADLFANPWWSVYAGAGIGAGVEIEVWDITILEYETDPPPILYEVLIASSGGSYNQAPEEPSQPNPADGATEVGIDTQLSWECTDPNDDPLTFDIYFGTENPPPLAASDVAVFSYTPGELGYSTIYFWRIVADDGHDHTVGGPLWSFATEAQPGGTGTPCPGLASITYLGKVYHTAFIGTQCWLKENLDAGTMLNSSTVQSDNGIIEKYCYQNQSINCSLYGGLYRWDELMGYSAAAGAQGICPDGWHLPTDQEIKDMELFLGMDTGELDLTGWRGTDQGTQLKPGGATGFDALMGGIFNLGFFSDIGTNGYFATSSEAGGSNAWARLLNTDNPKISRYQTLKQNAVSVRCLQD